MRSTVMTRVPFPKTETARSQHMNENTLLLQNWPTNQCNIISYVQQLTSPYTHYFQWEGKIFHWQYTTSLQKVKAHCRHVTGVLVAAVTTRTNFTHTIRLWLNCTFHKIQSCYALSEVELCPMLEQNVSGTLHHMWCPRAWHAGQLLGTVKPPAHTHTDTQWY